MTTHSDRTTQLLKTYRMNVDNRGFFAVREMILDDIRRFNELGADAYVADLRKALFRLDDEESTYCPALYHPANVEELIVGM